MILRIFQEEEECMLNLHTVLQEGMMKNVTVATITLPTVLTISPIQTSRTTMLPKLRN